MDRRIISLDIREVGLVVEHAPNLSEVAMDFWVVSFHTQAG
jgi:hypothetical protein